MDKNIELYVYDRNLNFKGVIDIYSSLRWRRKYFEAGEFELHLQTTKANIQMLEYDDIITKKDSIEAGYIANIVMDEDKNNTEMVITGRFLSYILHRRIVKRRINYTGNILAGMRRILNEMRPFEILQIENSSIDTENITFQVTYKNVYDRISKLSFASNVGFRIIPDFRNKKLLFQNFIGIDRTREQKNNPFYEFSEAFSNIEKASYILDASTLCNYVLVGGEGEGDSRTLVEIDKTEGLHDFDIVERFVDAKSETRDGLTELKYREILKEKGEEYIKEITKNINFDVYSNDYKNGWDLGDITTVKKESWNVSENLRITEVEEVFEKGGFSVTPTFGNPLAEKYIDDD